VPLATLVHAPGEVESAQDWQTPAQLVWQQTCCEQNPDPHSAAVTQAWPIPLRPQEPLLLQTAGDWQSAFEVQEFLQMLTPHWYGKQGVLFGVTQFPAPSQLEAPVKVDVPPGQLDPTHVVPDT
jgi:hypothetical protein